MTHVYKTSSRHVSFLTKTLCLKPQTQPSYTPFLTPFYPSTSLRLPSPSLLSLNLFSFALFPLFPLSTLLSFHLNPPFQTPLLPFNPLFPLQSPLPPSTSLSLPLHPRPSPFPQAQHKPSDLPPQHLPFKEFRNRLKGVVSTFNRVGFPLKERLRHCGAGNWALGEAGKR